MIPRLEPMLAVASEQRGGIGGQVVLRKKVTPQGRGRRLIKAVRGKGTVRMTTGEIMALTRGAARQ